MARRVLLLFKAYVDALVGDALDDRYEVVRLWQASDSEAMIDKRGAEAIAAMTTHMDAALLARLPNLRLLATPGTGYEDIDVAAVRARGVRIATAGATHSADVADHALALTLAAIHRIPEQSNFVREGVWGRKPAFVRRAMSAQRFGIVGFGAIGRAIAERLVPFGGEIAWWGPRAKGAPWPRRDSLLELAEWCTVLIVAARGDAAGLIDAATIAAVGPEGLIVNISRGAVIEEDALIAALREGRLGSAALDVFAQEPTPTQRWLDVPNTVLTPHIGGVSRESIARLREAAKRNLLAALDDGPLVNEIQPQK